MRSGWLSFRVAPQVGVLAAAGCLWFVGVAAAQEPAGAGAGAGQAPGAAAAPAPVQPDLRELDIAPAMIRDKFAGEHPYDKVELHRLCPSAAGDFIKPQSGPQVHPLTAATSGKTRAFEGIAADEVAGLWRSQMYFPHLDESLCHTPLYGIKFSYKGETTLQASMSFVCRNMILVDKGGRSLGIVSFDTRSAHSKLLRQKIEALLEDKAEPVGECLGEEPLAATVKRLRDATEQGMIKAGRKPAELKEKPGQTDPVLQTLSTELGIKGSVTTPLPPPPPPGTPVVPARK